MPPRKGVPTVFDPSFKGVGQSVGLEIWRVEKLAVVKKAASDKAYKGHLHEGDAYIILQTKQRASALERHIFFWLGKESSQDEQGVAAYKTVELDESLGGEPVQHREVQEHESDEFVGLFPSGLFYEPGGVATGFKHVDRDAFETRLLHVKGRRKIRVKQVPVDPASMNEGDSFILDMGREIIVWNGPEASRLEKSKAAETARNIKDQERGGNAKITQVSPPSDDIFWQKMGKKGKPKSASAAGGDDEHDRAAVANMTLYRVSNASGKMTVSEVATPKPYSKDALDTNDAFILDTGAAGIFIWVGKGADKEERAFAMTTATDFIKQKGYPNHTSVTRVTEKAETPLFKGLFESWPEPNALLPGQTPQRQNKFVKKSFSAATLHDKREAQKATLPDDGKGKLEIWRIEDFEMAAWPKDKYGHFYGGDSYVMLYTYLKNDKEEYIIYFWQGLKSSQDEKGASAIHAVQLDDKYGGAPVQVRVVQNKEPPHFLLVMQAFGGMVVHEGGRASGFKNVEDVDSYDLDGTRLFQVKGTNDWNTRAVQVPEVPASLNSGDVFVLDCPKGVFIWFGKGCTGDEREYAKKLAPRVKSNKGEISNVFEGDEPAAFWEALGWTDARTRPEYSSVKAEEGEEYREPRLFQCSNDKGYFYVEEIFDFDQEDLIEEDVMLLDTYYEVFVWVGKDANVEEKKKALESALEFIKTDPGKRTVDDVCIMQIKQGCEPSNFKCHFLAWDDNKWAKLRAAAAAAGEDSGPVDVNAALEEYSTTKKYPYHDLVENNLPESVDKTVKEQYLTDEDFEKYLKMSREAFAALPKWKQNQAKKNAKLF